MNPKMSLIVGTKITKRLLSARITAAIRKCLIQLKGLFENKSVETDVRICKKVEMVDQHTSFKIHSKNSCGKK